MYKVITPPLLGSSCDANERNAANENPTIAVIIPAYNAEKSLARIVNQTISQSHQPDEIIIVNDGSADSTAEIIADFQARYPDILKGVHQKNKGVAAARNVGIQQTQCQYVTFVDADDEINPDFLKNFITILKNDNSDLIVSGYVKLPSGSVSLSRSVYDRSQYQDVIMTKDIGITFCKIYSTDLIRKFNISFPEGMKASEDAVFYYRYLIHSNKCSFSEAMDYIYYAPASTKKYGANVEDELVGLKAMSEAIINVIKNISLDEEGVERLRKRIVISLHKTLNAILTIPQGERYEYYARIDWPLLLPYIQTDSPTRKILTANKFKWLETTRVIRAKLFRQTIYSYIK